MHRVIREPLFQFAVLAVCLFVVFEIRGEAGPDAPRVDRIEVSEADTARIARQYQATWTRLPTAEELERLVEDYIAEEVLVREALKLGLDRGDAAIRGRLRQKMVFLAESAAQTLEPEDTVLQAHLAQNPGQFAAPGKIGFEHIYLGQSPEPETVGRITAALEAGAPASELGERTLLPRGMELATALQIARVFGTSFFAALDAVETGVWAGPVRSGYGLHLVSVFARSEPEMPALDDIRDKVLEDWRRIQFRTIADAQLAQIRSGYEIIAPDPSVLQRVLAQ